MGERKMKKYISVVVTIIFVLLISTSCGKAPQDDTQGEIPTMDLVREVPAERVAKKTLEPATGFAGGDGSEESPYEISNAAELQYFANLFYGFSLTDEESIFSYQKKYQEAHYVLTNDIYVNTDAEMEKADVQAPTFRWDAIARDSGSDHIQHMRFKGTFDGQNHFISGLYNCVLGENRGEPDGTIGLFSKLENATVRNLTVRNSYFYVYNYTDAIGGLASVLYESDINNCHCENIKIYAHSSNGVGGLVGSVIGQANLSDCTVSGEVKSGYSSNVGGIVSNWSCGTMKNCTNNATVIAFENAIAGGICCMLSDAMADTATEVSQVTGCVNNGTVSGESFGAGGITARAHAGKANILFSDCKNNGAVSAKSGVGGIVGTLYADQSSVSNKDKLTGTFQVENCENRGEINGETEIGGIIGHTWADAATTGKISATRNFGKISGRSIGGIVGTAQVQNASTLTLERCENHGDIYGGKNAGGITGLFTTTDDSGSGYTFEITNCINKADVSTEGGEGRGIDNSTIGGILGKTVSVGSAKDQFIITDCANLGNINAKSDVFAGGIAGKVLSTAHDNKKISNCVNDGSISIEIADYDEEDTKIYNYVGGIIGAAQDTVALENCNSTGKFVVHSGNEEKVIYQDVCGMTVQSETNKD